MKLSYVYLSHLFALLFQSLLSLGAIAGGFIGGYIMQFFGRKISATVCGVPFIGGMLVQYGLQKQIFNFYLGYQCRHFDSMLESYAVDF